MRNTMPAWFASLLPFLMVMGAPEWFMTVIVAVALVPMNCLLIWLNVMERRTDTAIGISGMTVTRLGSSTVAPDATRKILAVWLIGSSFGQMRTSADGSRRK